MCECWPGFVGLNCAGRECPYGRALSDVPTGDDVAHGYLECSGRGECNRDDGTCVCYAGTEGQACSKLSCPNHCSGHGKCESIKNLARYIAVFLTHTTVGTLARPWVAVAMQGTKVPIVRLEVARWVTTL